MQYFGCIYFYIKFKKGTFSPVFLSNSYKKTMHLNRMWLMGPNKVIGLSVPLAGGRDNMQPLKEVKIANDKSWSRVHWRTIHDCYRKAPWFENYCDSLQTLYAAPPLFLWEWNYKCMEWVLDQMKELNVSLSEFENILPDNGITDISNEPLLNPPADHPFYLQVFSDRHGFIANLSILDLLFNEGPLAYKYLNLLSLNLNSNIPENEKGKL